MTLQRLSGGFWATPKHSVNSTFDGWHQYTGLAATGTGGWQAQYFIHYLPVRVPSRVVVVKLAYVPTSTAATGNIDLGIYDSLGTRLVNTGSTAKTASNSEVVVDVTDTTIGPGLHYLAICSDTTSDTFSYTSLTAPLGIAEGYMSETGTGVVLPTTASWSLSQTLTLYPVMGMYFSTVVS